MPRPRPSIAPTSAAPSVASSADRAATIVEVLERRARATPDALAFEVAGEALTYRDLRARSTVAAGALAAAGVAPGGRCALAFTTSADALVALFAVLRARAAAILLDPGLPAAAIWTRLGALAPALVVAADDLHDRLAAHRPDAASSADLVAWSTLAAPDDAATPGTVVGPAPGDLAYLQITSGTTGAAKAAMVGHDNVMACLAAMTRRMAIGDDDVFAGWVPLHHDMGLVRFVFLPLYSGRPCHLAAPSLAAIEGWPALMTRVGATLTGGPDFGYRLAARHGVAAGVDLGRLRYAVDGGEPVRADTVAAFERAFGCPGAVRPGYGLAEATLTVAGPAPGDARRVDANGAMSCGRPLDGLAVSIVGVDGAALGPGSVGEIVVAGPQVFRGYAGDDAATAAALRDGRLHTGDLGYLDGDGELFVLGRTRQLIKRAGAMIAPREVEEAADAVAGIRLSAAIGVPAAGRGEDLVLVAEIDERKLDTAARRALAEAVRRAVRARLGVMPDRVLLVGRGGVPRTANGKLRHGVLRAALENGAFAEAVLAAAGRGG